MAPLAFTRSGAGPNLVLLHALGSSRHAWDPVIPALAAHFDVVAIDLPGFGDSEPMPPHIEPLPATLASTVAAQLDSLGITTPHVAGNSLGGWVALELAHIRPLASLTLLSPAGLWKGPTPLYCRASLRATRWVTKNAPRLLSRLVSYRLGRILLLGQTHGRPSRMTPDQAREAIRAVGTCPGYDATLAGTLTRCYVAGPRIEAPVTVAFGTRDLVCLPRQSQHLDQLPPTTHVAALPGCGHVPMTDNPPAVTALIRAATGR